MAWGLPPALVKKDDAQFPPTVARSVEERAVVLEAEVGRWHLAHGDLLVDETSLAGTFALDRLVSQARRAGANVLLVSHPAQQGVVSADGALS